MKTMPVREEAPERRGLDRLDLFPQLRERAALDAAEHVGVAPFARASARRELALEHPIPDGEPLQRGAHRRDSEAKTSGYRGEQERSVGARIARDEIAERLGDGLEERLREPARRHHAERVAEAANVLCCGVTTLARDVEADEPPIALQLHNPARHRGRSAGSRAYLGLGEIAYREQEIVQSIRTVDGAAPVEPLQHQLHRGERVGIQQLAELGLSQELLQLGRVDRERLRAALGEGRVAVVDEARDVREHQRGREGRGRARIHRDDADPTRFYLPEELDQAGEIEDVAQALAIGLEDQREGSVARGHREEIGGALSRRPERRSLAGMAPRQQQRATGILAKPRREDRRLPEAPDHEVLDLVGGRQEDLDVRGLLRSGDPEHEPIVGPQALDVGVAPRLELAEDRGAPRRVDPRAEGREDAHAVIADLVEIPLDDQGAITRHLAGGLDLLAQIGHEVLRRERVEAVILVQTLDRLGGPGGADGAREGADRAAELRGTTGPVAVPERHLPGLAGSGGDEDAIVGYLLDAPRRGAEEEHLSGARLEHHLFVELTDPAALGALLLRGRGQIDSIQAAIRDGPAVDDGNALGALSRAEPATHAIPGEPRAKLGELVGGVAPGEHVEHALERASRELGERRGAADQGVERVDVDLVHADDGHDLLREDVERVLRIERLLDAPLHHPRGARRGGKEISTVLGEDHPARDGTDRVTRAADALQARGDGRRRLDLHDEVDGADVEPELERRGGDDRR